MKTRKKGFFNPLKVKELRRKMLLIIGVMFIIRLLNQIPTPGVNHDYLKQILGGSGAMGFMDLMTGGSLSSLSILALNISPYITASIVIELLSIVFKQLDEMKRDGKHGQEELKKITLYSAIGLSFIQALAMSVGFGRKGMLTHFTWYWVLIITLIWTASAGALAFVGNYMTEKKLCNGVSLILACNILSGVLDDLFSLWETAFTGHKTAQGILYISLLVVFIFLMTFFVVYLQTGKREIPVTNARKFNGRVNPAAMKSTLPIPVNPSNVIPVIFASCIFSIPSMIAMVVTPKSGSVWAHIVNLTNTSDWFRPSEFYYTAGWIVYVALILFFEVFYNNIIFNVLEISDNMKKAGSQIPGIRPGADTAEYLRKKVKHTTLLGGIGISIVATVPMVLSGVFHKEDQSSTEQCPGEEKTQTVLEKSHEEEKAQAAARKQEIKDMVSLYDDSNFFGENDIEDPYDGYDNADYAGYDDPEEPDYEDDVEEERSVCTPVNYHVDTTDSALTALAWFSEMVDRNGASEQEMAYVDTIVKMLAKFYFPHFVKQGYVDGKMRDTVKEIVDMMSGLV